VRGLRTRPGTRAGGWTARAGLGGLLLVLACEDGSYRAIGSDIKLLSAERSAQQEPAMVRLTAFGRRAIPQIETGLHTASEPGRLRLLATLERIGDEEAVPILRHFAVYDPSAEVRAACARVLGTWRAGNDARSRQALSALKRIGERRARGEGPLPDSPGPP
jgi:HEAT repeats